MWLSLEVLHSRKSFHSKKPPIQERAVIIVVSESTISNANMSSPKTHISVEKHEEWCWLLIARFETGNWKFELGLILRYSRSHLTRRASPLCSASHGSFGSSISSVLHTSSWPSLSLLM